MTGQSWLAGQGAAVTVLSLSLALPALAQAVPNAGAVLRQHEQDNPPPLPVPKAAAPPDAPGSAQPATGPALVASSFAFEGNTLFTDAQLQAIAAPWLHRPVTLADLEKAAAAVVLRYRAAGLLARVFLPPQQVNGGALTFRVIEARFGATRFTDDTDPKTLPVDEGTVTGFVEARQERGATFHVPDIERGLLLADDLPGVNVAGSETGGQQEGQTDVLVRATGEPVFYGQASLDNEGSRGTGQDRLSLRLGLNSPLGAGDQFDLQTQVTRFQDYARLAGSAPLGDDGLRLAFNVSALRYQVGAAEFRALQAHGSYFTTGADLIYPVVRATDRNLYLTFSLEEKLPRNTTVAGVASDYSIGNAVLNLNGNLYDTLLGSGVTTASLSGVIGHVDLGDSPNRAIDAATADTQGDFQALRWRLTRTQNFDRVWSMFASYSGQWASKNMDSAEKFYLGGPDGVRAYPLYEGGGSQGDMLNLELHWKPEIGRICSCELYSFYDWGRIEQDIDNMFPGAATLNRYEISGYGFGFAGDGPWGLYLSAVAGLRIGSNPNATPTGKDQDGSSPQTRFWLTLSKSI